MALLEVRLVRIDIPNNTNITCCIYSNSNKIGILSSLEYNDRENCLLIPMNGNLKIVVTSNQFPIGSVTFPFTLLNESGCLWLPIIPSGSSDYIDTLPEELSSPKILLYFEKKTQEESDDKIDELVETKEKLRMLTQTYQEFLKTTKIREFDLIKSLEDKETEIQDYIEQLSKTQSRIFSLLAEKKHLSDSLSRIQVEMSYDSNSEIREELELTRQELIKSESNNNQLLKKIEDLSSEWSYLEEESKHSKENDYLTQISQLRQELDLKNREISLLKSYSPQILSDISNKPQSYGKPLIDFTDTTKSSKPQKLLSSSSTDILQNNSFILESIQASMISEEENLIPNNLYSQPCSRGLSPGIKEFMKGRLEPDKNIKTSFRGSTISSQNKSRYIPIATSKRLNQSVERKFSK
ncbi:hypothetical protein SteCoe_32169 [Stentor coeruleus]|uniref:Uncharacterized protein n=1 Tax=Stentor coeruleus TaxID=5963 RepID=A0A1R2AZM5_9CILI|nr:hypothetical protein SteCoe_32169 [Stentor coeruleus]